MNTLPNMMGQDSNELMDIINQFGNIEIFKTDVVISLIHFKWNKYASKVHIVSAIIHFIYVMIFLLYVNRVYLYRDADTNSVKHAPLVCMSICHLYAFLYDFR